MDESRITSIIGSRNRERFQIDKVPMALIQRYSKYILIYTSRHLTMSISEVKRIFANSIFKDPEVGINPSFIKNNKDTYYAKVIFDKSVDPDRVKDAICDFIDNGSSHILSAYDHKRIETEVISIEKAIEIHGLEGAERMAVVKTRVNQGVFRELLIRKYNKCCLCGVDEEDLLIASHIKPWADSTRKERVDVENGLLLCPNHDKLFDKGYITFDEEGNIVISNALSKANQISMSISSEMKISMSLITKAYMRYHIDNIFIQ